MKKLLSLVIALAITAQAYSLQELQKDIDLTTTKTSTYWKEVFTPYKPTTTKTVIVVTKTVTTTTTEVTK